ncbi:MULTISPECIES: carbon-nitrogen family hydrolase [Streptomycetaceae]|uniref:Nitrilase/cyanide hydratase and apolipoprotein N-acyltransferase n=1 Tax=Streptantibioticus cattleyicolor (strain ATCC 35852 / DSM 46488 / JCM 4925 / NBRC 14057 / NRRL 8057) TaxID=1003195 RepID=F8JRA0_STREN|nr:carbon-nitrogen family hydrolase [Streptantibioticus cattleyicolor]AEW95405.1 Nitrilase/cyanide hydratase and apolipoprotein N-acyltransferase [Streptantibioticus cattleyicolor NRRL 8057 = DSM 46488]MYS59975.1 carbon-nitrogen family hydrolase [Streptomyces sp. SID5468]CCB75747.1 putative hydrolase [Streptantibioticus cattleyicolor NRRL 8057 = DSM 46488]
MRVSLIQIDVNPDEPGQVRRERVAALVRAERGADLVVLPELWPVGAFAFDEFAASAEPLDGPTATAMSAAARDAGVWLHAGSVVERGTDGSGAEALYNTSLLFAPDGTLRRAYRKIHRFGFDKGEATLMAAGHEIVTEDLGPATVGLATCYDLRFPEQFRLLVDAGAELLVVPAGWPARRRAHWSLLARARAVESQAYVLACGTAGTHAGVEQAGYSVIVDPWGEVVAEAGPAEQVLSADLDPARVATTRADFPVLRDRVLGLPTP